AEDGIRDFHVTGVQTCALPISAGPDPRLGCRPGPQGPALGPARALRPRRDRYPLGAAGAAAGAGAARALDRARAAHPGLRLDARSEERRVGKAARYKR